jgi:hypothetical protein
MVHAMLQAQIIGIPWYGAQNYAACRAVMADKDVLPVTYYEWRKKADRLVKELERSGKRIVHADIDAEQFPVWCRARGLNVDAKARMEFANDAAARVARH